MISLDPASDECTLLLLASRAVPGVEERERLRGLARSPINWNALLTVAVGNSVGHIAYRNLRDAEGVPSDVKERLRRAYLANGARNKLLARDLHQLDALLRSANIGYVTFKGAAVSLLAYGDLAARDTSDVDILVDPRRVLDAMAMLESSGYTSAYDLQPHERDFWIETNCEMPFFERRTRTAIDLHWAFTSEHFPFRLDALDVIRRSVPIDIDGVEVPTLSSIDNLLLLANHGTKHMWDRLEWIGSFAQIASNPAIVWPEVVRAAERAQISKQLHLAVYLSREYFGFAPDWVLEEGLARGERDFRRITAFVNGRLFRERSELGTSDIAKFQPLLYDDKWRGYAALARWVFLPMVSDKTAVRLPRALSPLHWVIRPARLGMKYLGRAMKRRPRP